MRLSVRRTSLAQRISLLATAIAVITAILAGTLAVGLIRSENGRAARQTLSRLADAAQQTADDGVSATASQARARRTLQALKVQSALINASGHLDRASPLALRSVTAADISSALAGSLSTQHTVGGQQVLIEGRRTPLGAIVLVQRRADATAIGDQAVRRVVLALVIAVVIAVLLGLLVAYRIARPLRRTAQAAHALAAGQRDVAVVPEGPAEVAEVGEAVNTLAAALSRSEARQREFLLSVSHDLRTPLTSIAGYAESLADGVVAAADAPRIGAIMVTEAHRLNRLVADLLDLARLNAQEFRVDLVPVELTGLARSAAQVWSDRCAAAGVEFRLELRPEPLWCVTDPSRVRQVLDGLFENALRVTPSGAPIVLAVRGIAQSAGYRASVQLEVRDGGPGLAEEDLAVAFDRSVLYERYRGQRQVGTGLGLAIVHGLVQRLGGMVQAGHSAEGGARFTVWLPAGAPPAARPDGPIS